MDGTNPKVSFIPKGSLVREESFLERRRPQSAIGLVAGIAFILAVSAYAGFYYFNDKLNQEVATKTIAIKTAQKAFSDTPEVGEAKVFRARADLALELLNKHTIASPVFAFLSKNTIESVLYNKFSFKNDSLGATIELSGEAPTYAALAYQTDVFRSKTKELSKFSVSNIALTNSGAVAFSVAMTFLPDYLLYTKNISSSDVVPEVQEQVTTPTPVTNVVAPELTTTTSGTTTTEVQTTATSNAAVDSLIGDWSMTPRDTATTSVAIKTEKGWQATLKSLWLKFKFW